MYFHMDLSSYSAYKIFLPIFLVLNECIENPDQDCPCKVEKGSQIETYVQNKNCSVYKVFSLGFLTKCPYYGRFQQSQVVYEQKPKGDRAAKHRDQKFIITQILRKLDN